MELKLLGPEFAVCKLERVDPAAFNRTWVFFARTKDEISLVCEAADIPGECLAVETGWRAFRIAGSLEFAMVGVLADISGTLAAADVSIFAVSTYDTDYILVKADKLEKAAQALVARGHTIAPD